MKDMIPRPNDPVNPLKAFFGAVFFTVSILPVIIGALLCFGIAGLFAYAMVKSALS
jgi:hypothetical protein